MIRISLLCVFFVLCANTFCNAQWWIGSAVRRRKKNIKNGTEIVPQVDSQNKGLVGFARKKVKSVKKEFKDTLDN